jgi:3-phosphoshikimate 1-carboxyvinyltransferase
LNNPDLVPVLATLAVFAETDSTFTGVSHLSYKESNRLERVVDLITKAGGQAWVGEFKGQKRLCVKGKGAGFRPNKFSYDPRPDHRLWMAAQLFKFANPEIEVSHPEVCAKSFPDLPQWVKQI